MPRSKSYQIKLLEDLQDPEEAAEYLNAALEDGNRELFLLALKDVADARGGLSKLADSTQLNRENLYRMLSNKGNPEFYSLSTLLNALGFRLAVEVQLSDSSKDVVSPATTDPLVLRAHKKPAALPKKELALAAASQGQEMERIVVLTSNGQEIGELDYDYQNAELYLTITGDFPSWPKLDIEVRTNDGKRFQAVAKKEFGSKLILLKGVHLIRDKIDTIVLKPQEYKSKG